MIDVTDAGAVRCIIFDRPEVRNAFDTAMYDAARAALRAAAADEAVQVLVLTGRGTAFSSGQDLRELERIAAGELRQEAEGGFRGMLGALTECPSQY